MLQVVPFVIFGLLTFLVNIAGKASGDETARYVSG